MSYNDPSYKEPQLAGIAYNFEELEIWPGILAMRGTAYTSVDRFGGWQIDEVLMEGHGFMPDRTYHAASTGYDLHIFNMICAALRGYRGDKIEREMVEAGE